MSTNLDRLTADAMKLPLRDRVQLAQRLVSRSSQAMKAIFHPEAHEEMIESSRVYDEPDRIFNAAVMHQHRRPGYWRKRLQT